MESMERQYDLESQKRILEIAVRLDAQKSELASRNELLKVGLELGLSEDSMRGAIEAFEAGQNTSLEPTRSASELDSNIPLAIVANVLQVIATYFVCLAWSRYNVSFGGATTFALMGIGAALMIGISTGRSVDTFLRSLKFQLIAIPVCLGLASLYNSNSFVYTISGAHWFYNSLAYASCFTVAMLAGAKVVGRRKFRFKGLLRRFLGEEARAV